MAVTNLMLVAASSNTVANQGTAAVTSATRIMDMLKSTSYANLTPPAGTPGRRRPGAVATATSPT